MSTSPRITPSAGLRATAPILLLWLAGLGAAGQFAKIGVPFADFLNRFPENGASVGLLLSLISLMGAIFGMIAGVTAARIGLGKAILIGLVAGGMISLLQSLLTGLTPLLISRIFEGASHLLIVVAAPTLIAQLAPPRQRNLAMTLWSTFFGVAYALTAWLGMPVVRVHGLDTLLRWHGYYMLICAASLALVLPRPVATLPQGRARLHDIVATQIHAYRSPWIAAPGIGWLFYTLTFVSLLSILPGLLPTGLRDRMLTILPLIGIASGLLVVPLLLRLLSAVRVAQLGFALAALMALMMIVTGPALPAVGLFAALGLIQGSSFAAVPTLNSSMEDRALANGLMAQMGNLGNLIGTPLLMVILARGGSGALVATIVGGYLLAILSHSWMERRRNRIPAVHADAMDG